MIKKNIVFGVSTTVTFVLALTIAFILSGSTGEAQTVYQCGGFTLLSIQQAASPATICDGTGAAASIVQTSPLQGAYNADTFWLGFCQE